MLSVTVIIAFIWFTWSFLAGLAIFSCAFAANHFILQYIRSNQKVIMKRKDQRMKVTTEAINNMRMIKLYSW